MLEGVRRRVAVVRQRRAFSSSGDYWERRYRAGGTSGAGSYGQVAQFKAQFINRFVKEHAITRVIDLGCGDGNQLSMLDLPQYVGLDVSHTAIDLCLRRHGDDPTKSFAWYDPARFQMPCLTADLVLSLDVLLHLVENDALARYMKLVDCAGSHWAIFFTEDHQRSPRDPHVRYRNIDDWLPLLPNWELIAQIGGPHISGHPSDADFFVLRRVRIPAQRKA